MPKGMARLQERKSEAKAQKQGQAEAAIDDFGHFSIAVLNGKAEVALGKSVNPFDVLHQHGLVETVYPSQPLDGLGRQGLARCRFLLPHPVGHDVAGRQLNHQKADQRDQKKGEYCGNETSNDVGCHNEFPVWRSPTICCRRPPLALAGSVQVRDLHPEGTSRRAASAATAACR